MEETAQGNPVFDKEEWRRYGLILIPCVLGMMLVALYVYTLGVVIAPLEEEFGWTRSEISAASLVTSTALLFLAPFGGRAVDRYGPRKIALIGVPAFSGAIAMLSLANSNILSWYALYLLLSFATVLVYPTVWTAAIAMRFVKNRGMALAITLSGTGLTSAIVPRVAAGLLEEFGWRGVYVGLGILCFVVVYPFVFALFDKTSPEDKKEASKAATETVSGAPPKELFRCKFNKLALAAFTYSAAVTMLAVNTVPVLMADGFELIRAAEIAGLIGVGTICGRLLGGLLLDRMDARYVAILCGLGAIIAVSILLAFDQSALAASAACFSLGVAGGAEYDACAYLATRHFDKRNFGTLFGLISGLTGFGAGVSPIVANAVYDITGSYDPVLWGLVPALAVASMLFLSIGRYPDAPER
ncbi:MFS transporter [Pontixanthobacter aquaemixtae]|uniref:MFS transporter n=1 Tax=Pontixanthobacter aquaemixtae TaxID=1958940 RepID=A0A844ZSX5_9SPHN|nr:MFS transporter [Pontixanthobacter aquaemixtae]MXO89907.1 MFS transporter [Pontixanthobacter aquaemixtae]